MSQQPLLNYSDILTRYKRMRKISFELNKVLPKYVPKEAMEATARKLGFWQDGILVFDNTDQSCVLFDQAIHGHFRDGKNAVDRYMDQHPPDPGSDQEVVLAAKKRAFYSLFKVEEIVPEVGVHVHDILYDRRHFLADVGFSQTAVEGVILASRAIPLGDFIMTTGAALPVDLDVMERLDEWLKEMCKSAQDKPNTTREEDAEVAAKIIALCLKSEGANRISYQGVDEDADDGVAPLAGKTHVGRNDPCPCGSGKKYKKCCGR